MSAPPDPSQASGPRSRPQLTPATVADDQALAEVVDRVIADDPEAEARLTDINLCSDALRVFLDAEGWRLFLMQDEMIVERWADLAL